MMAETTAEDEIIRRAGYTIYSRLKNQEPVWRSHDGTKVPHRVALGVAKLQAVDKQKAKGK